MDEKILIYAKKNIAAKEGVLTNKKGELDKIIAANEKEEKHFDKFLPEEIKQELAFRRAHFLINS